MADLTELYQSIILDHNRRPRNYGELPDADRRAEGRNPLCGDQVAVFVKLDGDRLADVRFTGQGCAISKASASLMTAAVSGKSVADADALFERVHDMMVGKAAGDGLGQLAALAGVSRFPVRVKCASLAWHALRNALHAPAAAPAQAIEPAKTE
jgi:nitrogen fixation protein NifU and related proteins